MIGLFRFVLAVLTSPFKSTMAVRTGVRAILKSGVIRCYDDASGRKLPKEILRRMAVLLLE